MMAQAPHLYAIAPDSMYQYDGFTHTDILQPALVTKKQ
jgi:hypothetical protein